MDAGPVLYLGAVPTVLAHTLFFVGLGAVKATPASVVASVEPLTATVIGVLFFGERSGAMVLGGTAPAVRRAVPRRSRGSRPSGVRTVP